MKKPIIDEMAEFRQRDYGKILNTHHVEAPMSYLKAEGDIPYAIKSINVSPKYIAVITECGKTFNIAMEKGSLKVKELQ